MARWFRNVTLDRVSTYELLGWMASPMLEGTHHAAHAVMMIWPCGCPMVEPIEFQRRELPR